jgi:hypothetical protein
MKSLAAGIAGALLVSKQPLGADFDNDTKDFGGGDFPWSDFDGKFNEPFASRWQAVNIEDKEEELFPVDSDVSLIIPTDTLQPGSAISIHVYQNDIEDIHLRVTDEILAEDKLLIPLPNYVVGTEITVRIRTSHNTPVYKRDDTI